MKCKKCPQKAVIKIPRANAAFCPEHFNEFFYKQTEKGIEDFRMLSKEDRTMVCVSGGKDSLVLWHVLSELGYDVTGMYIDLGIPGYSDRSKERVNTFAVRRGLKIITVDLKELGYAVPDVAKSAKRQDCSVCGTIKRYYFNKIAYDYNFDAVATGHNLDDESSRLLGNLLHWSEEYLPGMSPVLPAEGKMMKKKVKPLIRLTEKETAAFCIVNGIDYIMEECPMSRGATSLVYKDALNRIEDDMPGTAHYFYFQYFKKAKKWFSVPDRKGEGDTTLCESCGMETFTDKCSFCRLVEKMNEQS
ncbi:ATP-binding protein [Limisalsivibrio acetivorans]|uniref:ATP-binding protein n=1 Tax=Limisalsivibrio acetivorans TaxID=1304888 RepID=UPI0003B68239|nr:ATP-binding protein [Limisalsivibrio acetivorans]